MRVIGFEGDLQYDIPHCSIPDLEQVSVLGRFVCPVDIAKALADCDAMPT